MVGFSLSIRSTGDAMNRLVLSITQDKPSYGLAVAAQVASYLQQSVTPIWPEYLGIGIVLAIVGAILVARGDRKLTTVVEQAPFQSQPIPAKQQE